MSSLEENYKQVMNTLVTAATETSNTTLADIIFQFSTGQAESDIHLVQRAHVLICAKTCHDFYMAYMRAYGAYEKGGSKGEFLHGVREATVVYAQATAMLISAETCSKTPNYKPVACIENALIFLSHFLETEKRLYTYLWSATPFLLDVVPSSPVNRPQPRA